MKYEIPMMQQSGGGAINPWFMIAIFGTALVCIFLAVAALLKWHQPGAIYVLAGSFFYLAGTVLVTILCNVPLNDALAIAQPDSPDATNL